MKSASNDAAVAKALAQAALDEANILLRLNALPSEARFTPEEAAIYLNARLDLLRAWRSQGRGPPFEGRMHFVRYRKGALDTFMAGHVGKVHCDVCHAQDQTVRNFG
jgi:hypothetical protein